MKDARKTMVLTGASRGIGHATVKRFSEAGWRIITCSRSPLHPNCPWDAGEENHLQIDLASPAEIESGARELVEKLGGAPLHALVNNAGISPKSEAGDRMDSMSTPLDVWHGVFQVNVFAPVMLARALIEPLQQGNGTVVNVTSIAGSRVHEFAGTAYAASKAALSALTREMASDFGKRGVRVNAIAPGAVQTPLVDNYQLPEEIDFSLMAGYIGLREMSRPEDIAAFFAFLASDEARQVHGAILSVDAGLTAG